MDVNKSVEMLKDAQDSINKVRTRALDISFNELWDMFDSEELVISPEYQRMFRWSEVQQSQFIESLILELPIPPIFTLERDDGTYEVIDGLQRISTYMHLRGLIVRDGQRVRESLTLDGCDIIHSLNGATWDTLPRAIQIKLKRIFIRVQVLRKETDRTFRYHMFKRLNTGGAILSPQEIRNCTIRLLGNDFIDFINSVSQDENFLECTKRVQRQQKEQMYLQSYALRFFALKNNGANYVKNIDEFLTDYMERVSLGFITFDYDKEEEVFRNTFDVLRRVLGELVFTGYTEDGSSAGYFSVLQYEAICIGIQSCLGFVSEKIEEDLEAIKGLFVEMKSNEEFRSLVKGGGKNSQTEFRKRVEFVMDTLRRFFDVGE